MMRQKQTSRRFHPSRSIRARTSGRLMAFLLLWLFIAGCGQVPEAEPVEILSETAVTRTIQHTFGTSEIPKEPQRVVALGEDPLLADLLDIGIQPVLSIVNEPGGVALIAPEELAGTELVRSASNVSIETLLAYDPDLIIGTVFFVNEVGYERLAAIAPTVAVGGADPLETYIETLTVFGLRDQAEADVAAFREEVAAAAAQVNAAERQVSMAAIYPGGNVALFFDGPQAPPQLLHDLGVTMLPTGAARDELDVRNGRAFISDERWDLISGEHLILLQAPSVEGEMEAVAEVNENPLWAQLPAVQAGNVVTLDRLGYPGFRGQKALLQDLVAALE